MCDYSLMAIPNRLAVSGEELIVHRFEAGSVGLASAFDLRKRQECRRVQSHGFWPKLKQFLNPPDAPVIPAVCIPPGARLLVRDIPAELQPECGFQKDMGDVIFTQITAAVIPERKSPKVWMGCATASRNTFRWARVLPSGAR